VSIGKRHRNGFHLVELMIVVAIVGILATLAIPSYLIRNTMHEITEAAAIADIAKPPIALAWAAVQDFPATNADAGLPVADKIVNRYVTSVAVKDGAILITFGNSANQVITGQVLTLRPAVVEDAPIVPVVWICGDAAAPDKMTIKGVNKTTIPEMYLPYNCRAPGK
jgi:type IV pilus assembly protein PilA